MEPGGGGHEGFQRRTFGDGLRHVPGAGTDGQTANLVAIHGAHGLQELRGVADVHGLRGGVFDVARRATGFTVEPEIEGHCSHALPGKFLRVGVRHHLLDARPGAGHDHGGQLLTRFVIGGQEQIADHVHTFRLEGHAVQSGFEVGVARLRWRGDGEQSEGGGEGDHLWGLHTHHSFAARALDIGVLECGPVV